MTSQITQEDMQTGDYDYVLQLLSLCLINEENISFMFSSFFDKKSSMEMESSDPDCSFGDIQPVF